MSRLKNEEALWIQVMIMPADPSWKDEAGQIRDKMLKRSPPPKPRSAISKIAEFGKNLATAAARPPEWTPEKKAEDKESSLLRLSETEKNALKSIEEKASKHGFETNIRFIYIDRKDSFSGMNVFATTSSFLQYTDLSLNGFRPNKTTMTKTKGILKKRRLFMRKRFLHRNYLRLNWSEKVGILNTEELATIFHFPTTFVEAPLITRVETKKGGPPVDLPISR